MNTGESVDIYTGAAFRAICTGPAGSILGADERGRVMLLRWKHGSEELELNHSVETDITDAMYMCYAEYKYRKARL